MKRLKLIPLAFACSWACAGPETSSEPPPPAAMHQYVSSTLSLPNTSEARFDLSLDLDDDGTTDNALGLVLNVLRSSGMDMQPFTDQLVADGTIVLLHALRAADLEEDEGSSWQVYLGAKTLNPDYGGGGSFQVSTESSHEALLSGRIASGVFQGGPGTVPFRMYMSETEKVLFNFVGARIRAELTADGCHAVIGAAITETEIDGVMIPALARVMDSVVQADAGCPAACVAGSGAATITDLFDANLDGDISLDEVANHEAVELLLDPDVEIDGQPALSLGLGTTCVGASFEQP